LQELWELLHDDLIRPTLAVRVHWTSTLKFWLRSNFTATGSFQWMVGRSMGLSQPAVSKVVDGVTQALCTLAKVAITFPTSQQQLTANKLAFHNIAGFPNVVGCIDCSHVRIKAPSEAEDSYVNRKGVHTVNVQVVCDADMKITNVVAKWPGSAHDAFIWRNSSLEYLFAHGHIQGGWLLGKF
jgi:nuclease HARBI1